MAVKKRIKFNVDKLKECYRQPVGFFEALSQYPNNKYHLNIMEERAFWWDNIYGKYIPKIEKCRKCHKQTFSLIEKNFTS